MPRCGRIEEIDHTLIIDLSQSDLLQPMRAAFGEDGPQSIFRHRYK